jgi:hypothetical protein
MAAREAASEGTAGRMMRFSVRRLGFGEDIFVTKKCWFLSVTQVVRSRVIGRQHTQDYGVGKLYCI